MTRVDFKMGSRRDEEKMMIGFTHISVRRCCNEKMVRDKLSNNILAKEVC